LSRAEDAVVSLLPDRRRGSTWFGRLGDISQQPPAWAALAGALAACGGPRGRRAAVRGAVLYVVTAVVANLGVKPLVGRSRPPRAGKNRLGPVTSSFPSGHAATDLAFSLGVAQELPLLFLPLAIPIVVGGVGASVADDPARYLGFLALYDLVFAILCWASFEYVVTE
jgi:undecaprenyl-diphosphatase